MTQIYNYKIIIEPDDPSGYFVSVPALSGCYTQGETVEEAIKMAKEAIELHLEVLEEQNQEIPIEFGTIISDIQLERKVRA